MPRTKCRSFARFIALIGICAAAVSNVQADSVADFYKGRTITLVIGFPPANGADAYGRLVARFIGKHIPGHPNVVAQNMPGSGSLTMANYLYNVASKDGSVFGTFNRIVAMQSLTGDKNAHFDVRKFTWLGSTNAEPSLCVSWNASPVKTAEDALTKPFVIGAASLSANSGLVPTVLNTALGSKIKIIMGYPGANELALAMEQGEIEGRCGWSRNSLIASRPNWLGDGQIRLLMQTGLKASPAMPDVPLALDYAKTKEAKQLLKLAFAWDEMAWPFMAPPGLPADRATALKAAFEAVMSDPDLIAEAKVEKLDLNLVTAEQIDAILSDAYSTPQPVVEEMRSLLQEK